MEGCRRWMLYLATTCAVSAFFAGCASFQLRNATSGCNGGDEVDCARRGVYLTRIGQLEEGYIVLSEHCEKGIRNACQWKNKLFPDRADVADSLPQNKIASSKRNVSDVQQKESAVSRCENNDGQGCLELALGQQLKNNVDAEIVFDKALTLLTMECQAEGWASDSCLAIETASYRCPGKWLNCKILKLEVARSGGVNRSFDTRGIERALQESAKSRSISASKSEKPSGSIITGTGFLVCDDVIATNAHVISLAPKGIKIRKNEMFISEASLLVLDANNDLALLKIQDKKAQLAPAHKIKEFVDSGSLEIGQPVFTLGFPRSDVLGRGEKMTDGRISGLFGFGDDPSSFQVSVPFQPGNSGGPIVDSAGRLAGVAVARLRDGENVSFGVKTEYLAALIRSQKFPAALNCIIPAKVDVKLNEERIEQVVRKVQPAIFQVVVFN